MPYNEPMRRNPVFVWLASILTFGAYFVYWYWQTNETLRARGELVRPAFSALLVSWGAFLVVPALASMWMTADRVRNQRQKRGWEGPSPLVALLLILVLLTYPAYIQAHLNRVVEESER